MAFDPAYHDGFPSTSARPAEALFPTFGYRGCKVPGMESVVACITGYVGDEKSDLIKLINSSGGFYVGNLRKGATTHLVCKTFSGKKYEMAKRFGIQMVNHQWFEDCVKAGKRLFEGPYTSMSGKDVGVLCWKQPKQDLSLSATLGSSKSNIVNNNMLTDNAADNEILQKVVYSKSSPKSYISIDSIDSECSDQDLDFLLNYGSKTREKKKLKISKSQNIRYKAPKKCTKKQSSSRCSSQLNDSRSRNRTLHCASDYVSVSDESDTDARPIIQKTCPSSDACKYLEEEDECGPITFSRKNFQSKKRRNLLLPNFYSAGHIKEHELVNQATAGGLGTDTIEVEDNLNVVESSYSPTLCVREFMDVFPASSSSNIAENSEETHVACTLIPSDIACVICHAEEIASTEGLLGCGHNFCFACIKQWASEAASKTPTCPLCKTPFDIITKREQRIGVDGQLSSLEESVIVLGHHNLAGNFEARNSADASRPACVICGIGDTEELLLVCSGCGERSAHSFCLDPPLPLVPSTPWFCGRCSQRRRVDTSWWYQLHNIERLGD